MKLLPPPSTTRNLFAVGAAVGPVVDSLHNQCLLEYDVFPVSLAWPESQQHTTEYFFCSSWGVPPLLGIAYVVLGGVLPRLFEAVLERWSKPTLRGAIHTPTERILRNRALMAVVTTALIIKLSEFLEMHPTMMDGLLPIPTSDRNLIIMLLAALSQWALLDGTFPALLAATITSIGGPLSELPFVANGVWHYLPQAGDYVPLQDLAEPAASVASSLLGDNFRSLALSSITGPCYFAVCMDSIALGRWFDSFEKKNDL